MGASGDLTRKKAGQTGVLSIAGQERAAFAIIILFGIEESFLEAPEGATKIAFKETVFIKQED